MGNWTFYPNCAQLNQLDSGQQRQHYTSAFQGCSISVHRTSAIPQSFCKEFGSGAAPLGADHTREKICRANQKAM